MPPTSSTAVPGTAPSTPATGLLLTGGGARAAYQVGVLEAIADLRQACGVAHGPNPFPIITGTSAGAINAAALACGADHFDRAVRRIARVWRQFHANQVYGADSLSVMRSCARSSFSSSSMARTAMVPSWVNLMALLTRLVSTCFRRSGSPTRFSGVSR